ncbi:MAG: 2-oxo acid dehydrogenase subunit E2 [Acetanaerobacterium sp.]
MSLFTKQRGDGTYVRSREAFSKLMPHIMNTRAESVVYYPIEINVENALRYMDRKRAEGIRITLFNIVLAAIARTAMEYPKINRFVAGHRLYMHNGFQAAYVAKRQMTIEGDESLVKITFTHDDTLFDSADRMNVRRREVKKGAQEDVDRLIVFLSHLPRFMLRIVAFFLEQFEYFDMLPRDFTESLPYYCSVFASNLGSIGADAPFHHLYERGTCSIFLTLGRTFDKLVLEPDGRVRSAKHANIRATIDERICDGFYLTRALNRFQVLLANPELLEASYVQHRAQHSKRYQTAT